MNRTVNRTLEANLILKRNDMFDSLILISSIHLLSVRKVRNDQNPLPKKNHMKMERKMIKEFNFRKF